jgi:hypothetical protein
VVAPAEGVEATAADALAGVAGTMVAEGPIVAVLPVEEQAARLAAATRTMSTRAGRRFPGTDDPFRSTGTPDGVAAPPGRA